MIKNFFSNFASKAKSCATAVVAGIATVGATVTNGVISFGSGDTSLVNDIVQAIVSNLWNVAYFVAIPLVSLGALYLGIRAIMGFVRKKQTM